ncbi:MAG: hypothetical protein WCB97_09870 [Thiobacillus sp.]
MSEVVVIGLGQLGRVFAGRHARRLAAARCINPERIAAARLGAIPLRRPTP